MQKEPTQNQIIITKQVTRSKTNKVLILQIQGKLLNQYLKVRKIGEGPFSKIKLMIDTNTNKQRAMKKYNMFILRKKVKMGSKIGGQTKYSNQAQQVHKEIEVWKKLNHPNLAKLHEIIYDDEEEKIYLFMDYCKFGDISVWNHKNQTFVCKWPFKKVAKFFKEACLALDYMHNLNIVHRDIKPQNILICEDETAKIIDFGRSVQLQNSQQKLTGSEGTYHFMAPEMLSQKQEGGYNGKLCDIWSLGVSLFSVIFGALPFNDQFLVKLFQKIQKAQYKLPIKLTTQQQLFVPLIKKMLQVDWNKRPPLQQIIKKLQQIENKL